MSELRLPDLPSTAEHPVIRPVRTGRAFGVRLWLALIFAAIGILSGTSVYIFIARSSERAAEERASDRAAERAVELADSVGAAPRDDLTNVIARFRSDAFAPWAFNAKGDLQTQKYVEAADVRLKDVPGQAEARERALNGETFITDLPDGVSVIGLPIFREGVDGPVGAIVVQALRPDEASAALDALRGERLTALAIAVGVAVLIGVLVASLITTRVKRLAAAAGRIAEGDLSKPLYPRGRDEIGDLGRALDSMRVALAESFDALSSERDRLSAVFVSLDHAVIVAGSEGDVRFANPAAAEYVGNDGQPVEALRPWVRRALQRGAIDSDHVQIDDKVVAVSAEHLPAESAVLLVVRDRTEELRRDQAEREFVSNAAHELRNPIAGMSGAIEVLRSGAKDDPEARDHFLDRLASDVDRVSRLTKSLLTLARMEAIGEGEADVVDVELAVDESIATVDPPAGVELVVEVEAELIASADPLLLRQILIGLLTNAFKHTIAPGVVTLRAERGPDRQIVISVEDTGTGIPEEERDRVFERFYRGSGSLEREGFGLGLAIAKRMIDVMGGQITVESEEGRGSTFTVRLPEAIHSPTPIA